MEDRVLDWAVYEKTAREMAAEGLVLLKNGFCIWTYAEPLL